MASAAPPPPPLSHPGDAELLQRFLRPRIESGHKVEWIHEDDLYADDPDHLRARRAPLTTSEGPNWYFFTKLRLKPGFNDRVERAVPSGRGSWRSERTAKPVSAIVDGGGLAEIGARHTFCFSEKGEDGRFHRSGWLMAELRLAGDDPEPLTLSKMYPSPRDEAKAKAAARIKDGLHRAPSRSATSSPPLPPRGVHAGSRSVDAAAASRHLAGSRDTATSPPALPRPRGVHAGSRSADAAALGPRGGHRAGSTATSSPLPRPAGSRSTDAAASGPGGGHRAGSWTSPAPPRRELDLNVSPDASPSTPPPRTSLSPDASPSTPRRHSPSACNSPQGRRDVATSSSPPPPPQAPLPKRWMILEVGEEEDGLRRVFDTLQVELSGHNNNSGDANPFPSIGRKRKASEEHSGWLLMRTVTSAKNSRPALCSRCEASCSAV